MYLSAFYTPHFIADPELAILYDPKSFLAIFSKNQYYVLSKLS